MAVLPNTHDLMTEVKQFLESDVHASRSLQKRLRPTARATRFTPIRLIVPRVLLRLEEGDQVGRNLGRRARDQATTSIVWLDACAERPRPTALRRISRLAFPALMKVRLRADPYSPHLGPAHL